MFTYFLINLLSILFPLLFSFEKNRVYYASQWKYLFPALFLTGVFFIIWDIFFTRAGVWGFEKTYLLEYYLFSLPVEEYLFFITIPFSSIFLYECVRYFFRKYTLPRFGKMLCFLVGIGLLSSTPFLASKNYTFFCFLFTGIFLCIHFLLDAAWLPLFFITYFVHLVPFFIVNSILTGTFTDKPIVWYNNTETLSVRIGTIPLEDFFYALLLLLMNITYYEYFKRKKNS
ncbi:MAG: lycopene cyclase domain-containing protein [Chitinophagaceae bacterium]|nr:lycopene cyclase domain-containing protein [Chitinophagaceae bacterium]